jgi:hypothetical protein
MRTPPSETDRDVLACSKDPGNKRIPDHVPNPCGNTEMSASTAGEHAGSGRASNQPEVAERMFAERAVGSNAEQNCRHFRHWKSLLGRCELT